MHAISTLAFGFVSPVLLWGFLLAGVPLLIQWLHRRNYTERVWAAMRFLNAATASQSRRIRMESLLLLCLRTLILLLAALALAQPMFDADGRPGSVRQPVHTLIVLDTSLSMQATDNGVALGKLAMDAAEKLVRSGLSGDSYQLLTGTRTPVLVISKPSYSQESVLAELERIPATETLADVPETLSRAARALRDAPSEARRRMVVFSDFQQSNWRIEESAARDRARKALQDISREATINLVSLGPGEIPNLSITEVRADPAFAPVASPISITAQIRNFGPKAKPQARVQLLNEGRVVQSRRADVEAYGTTSVTFSTQCNEAGTHTWQVRLEDDALSADNVRWTGADVREQINVLLVNGRIADTPLKRATGFVELALQPPHTADVAHFPAGSRDWFIRPTVINDAELIRTDLSQFDCLFLCDVAFLSDDEVSRVEEFVLRGGGLVIGLGDQVQLDSYSRLLTGTGDGLLPITFAKVTGGDSGDAEPFRFAEPEAEHPLLKTFAGNPQSGLTTAAIYRYAETQIPSNSTSRAILTYGNGSAAFIENQYSAGRVVLVTTSLDDRWGSWALWPSFLPMMHELTRYVSTNVRVQDVTVGEAARLTLNPDVIGHAVELLRPDGRRTTLHLLSGSTTVEVSVDDASESGVYRVLKGETPLPELLIANVDARESDLQPLPPDGFTAGAFAGIPFQFGRSALPLASTSLPDAGSPITSWLLLSIVVLLFVEQTMAWNARYGLVALAVCPALVIGLAVLPHGALITVAIVAAIAGMYRWRRLLPMPSRFTR